MMKKIISFCFASFLLTVVCFAQEASADAKKSCTPTKECAEKMGMTLEQCKALCAKTALAQKENTTSTNAVAAVSMETGEKAATKKCCSSIEACAAKMGMTVAECKAKCQKMCGDKAKSASTTAVASAVMVSDKTEAPAAKAKTSCAKGKKACCKKKQ